LAEAEKGMSLAGIGIKAPNGTRLLALGLLMVLMLAFRREGLTGSRELGPLLRWRTRSERTRV
jgi:ABC-type branched-subunit amino acid transport system permease subunit